jgi:molybdenum cofactor cytidylyltransferase
VGAQPAKKIIINPGWQEGHASSIRAALDALPSQIDAAIFINADQPLLTSTVINKIIQRYRTTDASIIVPTYAGKRSNPVLFRRVHFAELGALRGEQGGRELIAKYPERVERIDFDDARLGADVDTWEEYSQLLGS